MRATIIFSILLIVGASWLAWEEWGADQAESEKTGRELVERKSKQSAPRSPLTSRAKSLAFLRSLPDRALDNSLLFEEVESMTRDLSDEDLFVLLEEMAEGSFSYNGYTGWLRSALWAELGRRNQPKAYALLLDQKKGKSQNYFSYLDEQANFAYVRGRMEALESMDEALGKFFPDMEEMMEAGIRVDMRLVSRRLAELDPVKAWEILEEKDKENVVGLVLSRLPNKSAYVGFFQGLKDRGVLETYMSRWEERMNQDEYREHYSNYQRQMAAQFSGFLRTPDEETTAITAAAELFRSDPVKAINWLKDTVPIEGHIDYQRSHQMWSYLGAHYPEGLMSYLGDPEWKDSHRSMAQAVISVNPSRVEEVVALLSDEKVLYSVLREGLIHTPHQMISDFFPEPEKYNGLPDYQERYEAYRRAIENSGLEGAKRVRLEKLLADRLSDLSK